MFSILLVKRSKLSSNERTGKYSENEVFTLEFNLIGLLVESIDDNKTDRGRAINRRTSFLIKNF
ncbi:hypothetical protein OA956_02165 [Bacteroidota bacterium]|nr:hypothetical protein [Bacteroidota bacterium]